MIGKNILLGDPKKIGRVWSKALCDELGLGEVITKDYAIAHPEEFSECEYIFSTWGMPHFTEDEIKSTFPALKAVFYAAGTVQSFAREFLACGVKVHSAWAANAVPVAEFTVAQIVLANKGYFMAERLFRSTKSKKTAAAHSARCAGNYRSTVGLIGCGMIGSMVAEKLAASQYRVLVCDPFLSDVRAENLGVIRASLDEVFSQADIVSNHLANNPQTVGMLTGRHFASMKPNAVFINTGRGAQVREDELAEVLKERPDLSALLDVTFPEPPDGASPFFTLPNVFLSPHIAGSLSGECVRMAEYMRDEYLRTVNGIPCLYCVDLKMLETMA